MADGILVQLQRLFQPGMAAQAWSAEAEERGKKIERFRRYVDGDFDEQMTDEMRRMVNIKKGDEFGANFCELVCSVMSDRLKVASIDADNERGKTWTADLLDSAGFDGLQIDVHDAVVCDGDTFIMVDWDNDRGEVRLTHELAFDGTEGVIPIFKRSDQNEMVAAVKIWHETRRAFADTIRVNIYYADRIVKYETTGGLLKELGVLEWTMKDGSPIGVPLVAFANRRRSKNPYGLSELENVIPLQNMLTRTLYSMTVIGEISAFQTRVAQGFTPPSDLMIGDWIVIPQAQEGMMEMKAYTLPAGQIAPSIEQAEYIVNLIYRVSSTPRETSPDASGEAKKEEENRLLSKVKRAQVKLGNAWEDVMRLAWYVQSAFGAAPPEIKSWTTIWRDAQMRNTNETTNLLRYLGADLSHKERLRMIGALYGWDAGKVDAVYEEKRQETADFAADIADGQAGYDGFDISVSDKPSNVTSLTLTTTAPPPAPTLTLPPNSLNGEGEQETTTVMQPTNTREETVTANGANANNG